MRGVVDPCSRSLDALDDRHRSARDREMPQIERHGEQDAAERVDDVPDRQIPGIAATGTSVLRSDVLIDCTTICALSQPPAVAAVATVNSTHSPPGNTWG
jgi:hypothetical protein